MEPETVDQFLRAFVVPLAPSPADGEEEEGDREQRGAAEQPAARSQRARAYRVRREEQERMGRSGAALGGSLLTSVDDLVNAHGAPHAGYVVVVQLAVVPNSYQPLSVGAYRIYGLSEDDRTALAVSGELTRELLDTPVEGGLFYNPELIDPEELMELPSRSWPEVVGPVSMPPSAVRRGRLNDDTKRLPRIMTAGEFVTRILYPMVYEHQALVVGYSLAEQLTRFTTRWGPGRGFYAGGFAIQLCPCGQKRKSGREHFCDWHPRLMVKQAGPSLCFLTFKARPAFRFRAANGTLHTVTHMDAVNPFVDLAMSCSALTHDNGPADLSASLSAFGLVGGQDSSSGEPGTRGLITLPVGTQLLETLRDRLDLLWQLYQRARGEVQDLGLGLALPDVRTSGAIAAALKRELGEPPFLEHQRELQPPKRLPPEIVGKGTSAYRGPRAEANVSHRPYLARTCDYTSAYAIGHTLAGIQELVYAEWWEAVPAMREAQDYLTAPNLLGRILDGKGRTEALRTFVLVQPRGARLLYSGPFAGPEHGAELAECYVHTRAPLPLPLAAAAIDVLHGGEPPEVLDAFRLVQHGRVKMRPIDLWGDPRYRIDPAQDVIAVKLVEYRAAIKRQLAQMEPGTREHARIAGRARLLKGLLVSGVYGLYLETHTRRLPGSDEVLLYADRVMTARTEAREEYGRHWCGPVAALVTGASHLLLAVAERLGADRGLALARCDTDGLDFTPVDPQAMSQEQFDAAVLDVLAEVQRLSPFPDAVPALRLEAWNYARDDPKRLEPLYGVACDEKLHQYYNRLPDGKLDIRHLSMHGMSPMMQPATEVYWSPPDIPAPRQEVASLANGRGMRLGYDLAYRYIERAERGIRWLPQARVELAGLDLPAIGTRRMVNPAMLKRHQKEIPELLPYSRVLTFGPVTGRHLMQRAVEQDRRELMSAGAAHHTLWPIGGALPPADEIATCQELAEGRFQRTGKKLRTPRPAGAPLSKRASSDQVGWHERPIIQEGQRFYTGKVARYLPDQDAMAASQVRYRAAIPVDGDVVAAMRRHELDDLAWACPPPPSRKSARQWQKRLGEYQSGYRPAPAEHQSLIWNGLAALDADPLVRPFEETHARLARLLQDRGLSVQALADLLGVRRQDLSHWLSDRTPKREQRRALVRQLDEAERRVKESPADPPTSSRKATP